MATPVLATKLYAPPPRPGCVSRKRLLERLTAGLQRKLTLVSAPAGFGKTSLLGEWTAQCQRPVAWLTLDRDDNDPTRFLTYLHAAFRSVGVSGALVTGPPQPKRPAVKSALSALINHVASTDENLILVLDDYQMITAGGVHAAITFLIDHLPDTLHLVIASRSDPPLPLARLRGRGQLNELRQADLRFTSAETAEFLQRTMGLKLSEHQAAALAERTEGWIAGLQMAAVSLQGRADAAAFVEAFAGTHRYILDYLLEEVLQQQPPSRQLFLLQTAVLDRLTGSLCDAVTEQKSGRATLEALERANLFIVPLDDERRWYRYHQLFSDLLRKRLEQVHPDLAPALHRRASRWYAKSGRSDRAIHHALAAHDFEYAADLIEGATESVWMRSEISTFLRWVEALPEDTVQARPRLGVFHAGALLISGRPLETVQSRLQEVEAADGADVAGELAAFRALIAAFQGDIARSLALSEQALAHLPEESLFLRSIVANNLGMVHLLSGDVAAGTQAFEEATRTGRAAGNIAVAVGATCNLAGLCLFQGEMERAKALYRRALEWARDDEGQALPVASKALIGLGEILRAQNDLGAAAEHLSRGIELVQQYGEVGAIMGYTSLAFIRHAQGDWEGAHQALAQGREIAVQFDVTDMDDRLVDACEARFWLAEGNVEAAARWAVKRDLLHDDGVRRPPAAPAVGSPHYDLLEVEYLTLVRLLLVQGRPKEALDVLAPLLAADEERGRTRRTVEVRILMALAQEAQGESETALETLERALVEAAPENHIRIFLDEGAPMVPLLHQAASRSAAPETARRLLVALEGQGSVVARRPTPLVEPLSDREREILRYLPSHLSSTEVAEELTISVNTVRFHIKNIYSKLNVHSRSDAVDRARELNLL